MNSKTLGFIGGGGVTRILLEGWRRQNALPAKIVVSDRNADSLAKLKAHFPLLETAPGNSAAAARQDITPAEVMDLIPVKPLAEMEPQVAEMYRTRLPALYQKIKP